MIYLDTETTGLGDNAEVVQIGIIDDNENVLLDCLVKSCFTCPASATDIHGIFNSDLSNASPISYFYPLINYYFNTHDICIYNASYDVRLLNQSFQILKELEHFAFHDLSISKSYCLMQDIADKYYSGKWQKLINLANDFEIKTSDIKFHSAIGDCIVTKRVHEKFLIMQR